MHLTEVRSAFAVNRIFELRVYHRQFENRRCGNYHFSNISARLDPVVCGSCPMQSLRRILSFWAAARFFGQGGRFSHF